MLSTVNPFPALCSLERELLLCEPGTEILLWPCLTKVCSSWSPIAIYGAWTPKCPCESKCKVSKGLQNFYHSWTCTEVNVPLGDFTEPGNKKAGMPWHRSGKQCEPTSRRSRPFFAGQALGWWSAGQGATQTKGSPHPASGQKCLHILKLRKSAPPLGTFQCSTRHMKMKWVYSLHHVNLHSCSIVTV